MVPAELKNLRLGNTVRHIATQVWFIVHEAQGIYVNVVRTVLLGESHGWVLVVDGEPSSKRIETHQLKQGDLVRNIKLDVTYAVISSARGAGIVTLAIVRMIDQGNMNEWEVIPTGIEHL